MIASMNIARLSFSICVSVLGMPAWFALAPANAQGGGDLPPATVQVELAIEDEVAPMRQFVGTVKASRRSIIGSAVDGRVTDYLVEAGQAVDEKQELAQLLTGTIELEIKVAEAEERLRQAELDELIQGARAEEIAQAEAQLSAATALESYAKSRYERTRQLSRSGGAISAEELDLAVSQFRSAEQRRIEYQEVLDLLRAGTRKEKIAQAVARHEAQVEQVNLLNDRLAKYTLKSPFAGFVVREYTEAGAWVRQGDPIAEVVDIDPIEIEVKVPEETIRFIARTEKVKVLIPAVRDEPFSGEIAQIVPEADMQSRTFPVIIRVQNSTTDPAMLIRPGMLARVPLPTYATVRGLTVPKDAVVTIGTASTVFKVVAGKAVPVTVVVKVESDDRLLIEGDLSDGDQVVSRGNERLRPGQPLIIQSATRAEKK
jgi:RND family efflux transporter MFP subunit